MKNICFQMTRKALVVLALMLATALPALAQNITVTGTVYEPEGEPAIGASVEVKGTPERAWQPISTVTTKLL